MAPPKKLDPDKAAKGLGAKLGKKLGPLPLWAWLGLGAAGLFILYMYAKGQEDEVFGGPELVSGGIGPQDMAGAGAPAENAPPGQQLSPEVEAQLQALAARVADVGGKWEEFEDAAESAGWSFQDGMIVPPVAEEGVISDTWPVEDATDPVGAVVNSNGGVQTRQQLAASIGGVAWGGQIFTTKRAMAGWLGQHGGSYATWARNHPTAAKRLGGPAPKPKPRPKPKPKPRPKPPVRRTAPKPKPRPRPKPKARVQRKPVKRRKVVRRKPPQRRGI